MKLNFKNFKIVRDDGIASSDVEVISPGNRKKFLGLIGQYGWRLTALSLYTRSRKIIARIQFIRRWGEYLIYLHKKHGATYVVKYLKASQLAIQKAIAGTALKSLRELEPDLPLPRLSKSGLPAFIGSMDRAAMKAARPAMGVVRFYLTLYSIYRVLDAPLVPKLQTIVKPYGGSLKALEEVKDYVRMNRSLDLFSKFPFKPTNGFLMIFKSSPTSSPSWLGLLSDIHVLHEYHNKTLFDIAEWVKLSGNEKLRRQLKSAMDAVRWFYKQGYTFESFKETNYIGQLAFKPEPAGKLRVFAMVDVWTQSALKGFHEYLFDILRRIPNDGTHDQHASFRRCVEKSIAYRCSYGYDLSAATDRLPMSVQTILVERLLGKQLAAIWERLLVGRDYIIPDSKKTKSYGLKPGAYRYAVGQPMGAYSSWAMLALTHHMIVQMAAALAYPAVFGAGKKAWCELYELLGDDINIFDKKVAHEYLGIMNSLNVEINLTKSVVTERREPEQTRRTPIVCEFAKRTSLNGVDVSAISWKMLIANQGDVPRCMIALYLARKGIGNISNFLEIMALPGSKWIKRTKFTDRLNRHIHKFYDTAVGTLLNGGNVGIDQLGPFLIDIKNPKDWFLNKTNLKFSKSFTRWAIGNYLNQGQVLVEPDVERSSIWDGEKAFFKEALVDDVLRVYKRLTDVDYVSRAICLLAAVVFFNTFVPKRPEELEAWEEFKAENLQWRSDRQRNYQRVKTAMDLWLNPEAQNILIRLVVDVIGLRAVQDQLREQIWEVEALKERENILNANEDPNVSPWAKANAYADHLLEITSKKGGRLTVEEVSKLNRLEYEASLKQEGIDTSYDAWLAAEGESEMTFEQLLLLKEQCESLGSILDIADKAINKMLGIPVSTQVPILGTKKLRRILQYSPGLQVDFKDFTAWAFEQGY